MSTDEWAAARARCRAATDDDEALAPHEGCDCADCRFGRNARRDLIAALDAIDAGDLRVAELIALVHKLSERVHSQAEKLGRRAEKRPVQ